MDTLNLTRCSALNNIPTRKLQQALEAVKRSGDDFITQNIKTTAINRYAESNIPIEYWTLKMESDFVGDPRLLTRYNEYIADLQSVYLEGKSICLAGSHGLGKTFLCTSILKKACAKGYSCLYSDMSNIISVLTSAAHEDRFAAKRELSLVDFLAIDEIDTRFFNSSDATNELFARNLESVFRTRSQNKLPTLMCTNSPNLKEGFTGALKASLGSLMTGYLEVFPVFGNDFRKTAGGYTDEQIATRKELNKDGIDISPPINNKQINQDRDNGIVIK